jgi:hypothetical protein
VLPAHSPASVAERLITSDIAPAGSKNSKLASAAFTCAAMPMMVRVLFSADTVAPPILLAEISAPAFCATTVNVIVPPPGSCTKIPPGGSPSSDDTPLA